MAPTLHWLLFVVATGLSLSVDAHREYVSRIPNGNNVGSVHALGHIAWDGAGPRNDFGKAFAAAGAVWTKALCEGDADGDGQTNGEELGDPCCVWRENDGRPPLVTDVLSHPGDFGSKLNATALRDRLRDCQALRATSGSSGSSRPDPSGSALKNDDKDGSSIHPPTSAVPTPTASAACSRGCVPPYWVLAGTITVILVIV